MIQKWGRSKPKPTLEEIIRIIEPHCKIGTVAIRLLRKEGLEVAIEYLRKYGVREDQIQLLKTNIENQY